MEMQSNKKIDDTQNTPSRRFWQFLPFESPEEILDFGLSSSELYKANKLAEWLGIKECFLKLETTHPTLTVKDRTTELLFSYFAKNGIKEYSHCSTGNTGTSLAWGVENYSKEFLLNLLIPERQHSHYNFKKRKGIKTSLIQNANYDQSKQYTKKVSGSMAKKNEILGLSSDFRKEANKLPYLEAYEQMLKLGVTPDYVVQACSSATGLIGGWRGVKDFIDIGMFSKAPGMVVIQPEEANPIARCYKQGLETYESLLTIDSPKESLAWAIRRGDARSCYGEVYSMIKESNGWADSATEKGIIEAKRKVLELEGIDIGYSAATSIAGIKERNSDTPNLSNAVMLFMITGKDRSMDLVTEIDNIISETKWRSIINL